MSFTVTTAFVQQYNSNVELLLQQRGSKLRDTVRVKSGVVGEADYVDQIGAVIPQKVTTRHADSPLISTPHDRRKITPVDYDIGDMIDGEDRLRTMADFESPYVENAGLSFGRQIDQVIIDAVSGSAFSGKAGGTTETFDTGQRVAVDYVESGAAANSDLTIGKLREAKRLLDVNNVPQGERTLVITSSQINSLLRSTEIGSVDFNETRALVDGRISKFMGFDFKDVEDTDNVGLALSTNTRTCIGYHKTGIQLNMWKDIQTNIDQRSDKRFSWYYMMTMTLGATRLQEESVIEILCDESA